MPQELIKIVLTGPESTGKTTLATELSRFYKAYGAMTILEYARIYIDKLNRPYEQKDLLKIAKGQIAIEEKAIKEQAIKDNPNKKLIFLDTDLITIKIWSEYKYKTCDKWILEQIEKRQYSLYLLCGTDIPWEYDAQRENPNPEERLELYKLYKQELIALNKDFVEVKGNKEQRLQKAVAEIEARYTL